MSKTADKLNKFDVQDADLEKRIDETTANGITNMSNIKEIVSKVTSQENRMTDIENESDSSKTRTSKLNENVKTISKTVQVYEARHYETIERIKEVSVLANNIEVNVKTQEQRIKKQKVNEFNQFDNQLEVLTKNQESLSKSISDIDKKPPHIDGKHKNIGQKF